MSDDNGFPIKRTFFTLALGLLAAIWLLYSFASTTYASLAQNNPEVLITINNNGEVSCTGSLFGNDLWYPGYSKSGIIRIKNNFKDIKVDSLGLSVKLNSYKSGLESKIVYDSFINNMKLSVARGKLLTFNEVIWDSKRFSELLHEPGKDNYNGINLGEHGFFIGKNDTVDLQYTLFMSEESGDELENVSADVGFIINAGE